ncbi:uncharacterized protein LOC129240749 [Anastrepha obliqua]|uniref:uncharacterized protein LOC129240749 n=1 Tax=Anastrepha obliqua TaxID=95512 RepID=UPI002409FD5E|nr:uncharacterized protein LOC129240749 [Anastrepha obliqua]
MSFNNGGTDFDFLLTEDFLLFLDLCRDPNQVFKPNSDESCLAQTWLDKLCRYECKDLDERRLRNIYMSYLCCCLIEGVLKGPFASYPRAGPLQRVDFNPKQKQPLSCPPLIKVKSYKECEDTKNRYNDSCEQQLSICCCSKDDRFNDVSVGVGGSGSGGSEVMRCCPEVRFSTDIQCKPDDAPKRTSGHVFSDYMLREITSPGAYNTFKSCDSCQEYDPYGQAKKIMRQDVENLLQAIGAELRGYVGCGCNDYLESELSRYKNFIMNFSSIACALAKMESLPALRSFLLINLQNDLIKLLSDNCL